MSVLTRIISHANFDDIFKLIFVEKRTNANILTNCKKVNEMCVVLWRFEPPELNHEFLPVAYFFTVGFALWVTLICRALSKSTNRYYFWSCMCRFQTLDKYFVESSGTAVTLKQKCFSHQACSVSKQSSTVDQKPWVRCPPPQALFYVLNI